MYVYVGVVSSVMCGTCSRQCVSAHLSRVCAALVCAQSESVETNGLSEIPDSFVVGTLYPDDVDFLDLRTLKRNHWTLGVDGEWSMVEGYAPPVVSTC
jgi:hypothetical protein